MEKLLDSWRKRYLTLSGKVCIINSLALSKLYYCASILNFPNSENVKTINRLIFNFIWGSRDRIKRNTLIGREKGRDLTQSRDKNPYIHRIIKKKQRDNIKRHQKL